MKQYPVSGPENFFGGDQLSQKTMINDLTNGSVAKQLMKFAGPFILANLLQNVYNMVDMIVVGQFVGSSALSAVSIGGDILHLATFIVMGVGSAGQILIAQYVGNKRQDKLSSTIGTMFSSLTIIAVIMTFVGLFFRDALLDLLNTPEEAYSQAQDYCTICYLGLIFIYGYNIVSSVLRGMGDSKRPLMFIAIAAVMNLVLDLVFVAGLGMKSFGAALATVIGQGFSFIVSVIYLYRRREAFGFDFKLKSFKIDLPSLKALAKLGVPLALQMSAITISSMFVNSYINSYGVVVSAVTGVGNKIALVMSVITQSFGTAGSSMVGQNFGAGKFDRIRKVLWFSLLINVAFALVLTAVMLIDAEGVFSLFNTDPEVLAMASVYAPIAILNFFGFATRNPFMALINGLGHGRLSLFIGICDGIVARIGLAMLLGIVLDMGIMGFWLGSVFAGFVPTIIGLIYYFSGSWKKRQLNLG